MSVVDFRQINGSTFDGTVPGERLPPDAYRKLTSELSAKTTVYGLNFREVLMEGQHKGRKVKLHLRTQDVEPLWP